MALARSKPASAKGTMVSRSRCNFAIFVSLEVAQQRVLRRSQADAAQFLVVDPADGPRRLPQGIAQARRGRQQVGLRVPIGCICNQLVLGKGLLAVFLRGATKRRSRSERGAYCGA